MYVTGFRMCLILQMIRLLSSILHYYEGSPEEKSVVVLQPNLDDEQRQETEYGMYKHCICYHV